MWADKSVHGDVVKDKMGNPEDYLDDRVKMVGLNFKKVSRDLPTVGERIMKLKKEPPCPWRGRRWRLGCGRRQGGR